MGGGCPVAMRPGVPRGVLRPHTLSACALTPQRGKRGTQIPPRSLKKRGVSFHTQIHAFCHFPNAVGSTRATLASTPGSGSCRGRTRRTAATPAAPTATYDPIRIRSCRFEHDDHLHLFCFCFSRITRARIVRPATIAAAAAPELFSASPSLSPDGTLCSSKDVSRA